jgi:hypothetical protein
MRVGDLVKVSDEFLKETDLFKNKVGLVTGVFDSLGLVRLLVGSTIHFLKKDKLEVLCK